MVSFTKKLRFYPLLITLLIGIDIDLYFGKILHRTILERRVSFIPGMCRTIKTFLLLYLMSKMIRTWIICERLKMPMLKVRLSFIISVKVATTVYGRYPKIANEEFRPTRVRVNMWPTITKILSTSDFTCII